MKRIFLASAVFVFAAVFFFLKTAPVRAQQQFNTKMNVTYTVFPTGDVRIVHKITIQNKFSVAYPKNYVLRVGVPDAKDIMAADDRGASLTPTVVKTDSETNITVVLPAKVGRDKELTFTIEYTHPSLAILTGKKVLELDVPKLLNADEFDEYVIHVRIPTEFGDPLVAMPPSFSLTQSGNYAEYTFQNAGKTGISMAFGNHQQYSFRLQYHVQNTSVSQGIVQVALPMDTAYQRVSFSRIDPKPDFIERDLDGNWIATFTLGGQESAEIHAEGTVTVWMTPQEFMRTEFPGKEYLNGQKFWEVDDPEIQKKARELRTVRAIYDYVTSTIQYDYARLSEGKTERQGAKATIQNPSAALCQEFTDLFITLSRAAGIPAREVNGYAYTNNETLRPLSLVADVLHAWPEYYDEGLKVWVPVDPTWGYTTGGLDYYTKRDLHRVAFVIHGQSSERPYSAGLYKLDGQNIKDVEVALIQDDTEMLPLSVEMEESSKVSAQTILVRNMTGSAWYQVPVEIQRELDEAEEQKISVLLPFQTEKVNVQKNQSIKNTLFAFTKPAERVTMRVGQSEFTAELSGGSRDALIRTVGLAALGSVGAVGAWRLLVHRQKRHHSVRR